MEKKNPNHPGGRGPVRPPAVPAATFRVATLVGVAVLIAITGMNLYETTQQQTALNERLNQIDSRVTAIGTKIDAGAKVAQQRPQGPDPDKVHAVKIDGEPFVGPLTPPVTHVEVSGFRRPVCGS